MKIEGRNAVNEIIKTDKEIDKVLVDKALKDNASLRLISVLRNKQIKLQYVDKYVLDKESSERRHQGFIAFVSEYEYNELEEIIGATEGKQDALIVVLEEVTDPHNLGSIIRVLECAGADGLIIGKNRSASVNDAVMRISEGAASHLKIARVVNINKALDDLKANGFWVTGAELGGEDLYKSDLTGRTVLVIGGEDSGIKRLTKEKCDRIVTIPMFGKVNSLNASVACGVIVYEIVRQRTSK